MSIHARDGDAKEVPGTAAQYTPSPTVHHAGGPRPLLEALNDSTKWTVSLLVFGALLYRRDLISAWGVIGSIVAAIFCKILKFLIRQSRPPSARKADPGMPSSHANSLAFLSIYVSLSSISRTVPGSVGYAALVLGIPAAAVFFAWLRVSLGFHTTAQVIVGWLVGSSLAAGWSYLGNSIALPFLQAHPESQMYLWLATMVAVAVFVGQNGVHWAAELRERRREAYKVA